MGQASNCRGDWNSSGVILKIESLSTLYQLESGLEKFFSIDCSGIRSVDMSGLQLLHVWMQCVKLRGAKPKLVNIPEGMRQMIRRFRLEKCFADFQPENAQKTISDNQEHPGTRSRLPETNWESNELPDFFHLRNSDCLSHVEKSHQSNEC
jgi:ABC-type transporter Mla MlaB component